MAKREDRFAIRIAAVEMRVRENAFAYGLTAIAAIALKYGYSKASAEELYWLMAPLARLVEILAGIHFDWEPPNGFVSTTFRVIIAPACSGVTFLVICFCTLSFSLMHRRIKPVAKLAWIVFALLAAYAVTLSANAFRIVAAIVLYRVDIYEGWITPDRVHRIVGIAVYLGVLLGVYLATERMSRVHAPPIGSRLLAIRATFPPFTWYILFTIVIPVLKALDRDGNALLTEHVLAVGTASAAAFVVCLGLFMTRAKKIDLPGGEREDDRSRIFSMVGIKTIKEQEVAKR